MKIWWPNVLKITNSYSCSRNKFSYNNFCLSFFLSIKSYFQQKNIIRLPENKKVLCVENENIQETDFWLQKISDCTSNRLFYLLYKADFYNIIGRKLQFCWVSSNPMWQLVNYNWWNKKQHEKNIFHFEKILWRRYAFHGNRFDSEI